MGENQRLPTFNDFRDNEGKDSCYQQTTSQQSNEQTQQVQQVQQQVGSTGEQWIAEEQRPEAQSQQPNVVQQFAQRQLQRASKAAVKEGKQSVNIIYSSLLDLYNVFMDSRSLISKPIIICFAIIGFTVVIWNLVFGYFTFIEPLQILATLIIYLILAGIVKALQVSAFSRLKDYIRKEVNKNERSNRKK